MFAMFVMIVGLFFTAAFTSCNKDDDDDNNGSDKVKLLETITYDGYTKYEYDAQNRFTKISWYPDKVTATPRETHTFTYNSDDLVKVVIVEAVVYVDTYEFAKNGNKITATFTQEYQNNVVGTYTKSFDLNSDGTLAKVLDSGDDESYEYSYQYQGGNLTKMSYKITDKDGTFTGAAEFKYDSKNSPFLHCKTPKWYMIWWMEEEGSKNNVTEISWDDDEETVYTNEYEYDSDGYPTKCTFKDEKGRSNVWEYTYKQ